MRPSLLLALVLAVPALAACTENAPPGRRRRRRRRRGPSTVELDRRRRATLSATEAPAGTADLRRHQRPARRSPSSTCSARTGCGSSARSRTSARSLNRAAGRQRARRHLRHRLQAGHEGRGHPRRLHRHRVRRGADGQRRRPGAGRPGAGQLRGVRPGPVRPAAGEDRSSSSTLYKSGDDDAARALYPDARTHWERIETVAESFGDLDPQMDAREADLEPGQKWTGWHRIEKDLWPRARRGLHAADARASGRRTPTTCWPTPRPSTSGSGRSTFTVDQIANGSRGLLEEVATGKVTGEEEYWSRTDLWDFQANVDGARVGFEGVRPILEQKDPDAREHARRPLRRAADAARRAARRATASRSTTSSRRDEVKALADAVNALSEPLSQPHRGRARPEALA